MASMRMISRLHPKRLGKRVLCALLEAQVRRLRRRNSFRLITVVGSIGKTSTKAAMASTLAATTRVRWQTGNYNDRLTVPLVFFDQAEPNIFNAWAWLRVLLHNERIIRRPYPYDFVIVELGPDRPGQVAEFAYLQSDLAVLTAIAPEHMEFFGTLDAVAAEELVALDSAKQALVNVDDVASEYLTGRDFVSYGLSAKGTYRAERGQASAAGQEIVFRRGEELRVTATIPILGTQGAKIALAAFAAADVLGLDEQAIAKGLATVQPFPGRMQLLRGQQETLLIDDTYNASPLAVKAALDVLYSIAAPQRIAILGSMNELGAYSEEAHREVGLYCDPAKLDEVVVVGNEAEQYLVPALQERGCTIKTFANPYDAGAYVRGKLKPKAVVLAKGSQSGIFTEEALKQLLADPADAAKLVRQSPYWMNQKRKQFGR